MSLIDDCNKSFRRLEERRGGRQLEDLKSENLFSVEDSFSKAYRRVASNWGLQRSQSQSQSPHRPNGEKAVERGRYGRKTSAATSSRA